MRSRPCRPWPSCWLHSRPVLPESIESVTVLRTGLQSMRRTQVFSDYRRFLTESRIKVR